MSLYSLCPPIPTSPSAFWTGQQILQACLDREPAKFLIRDRNGIYGKDFVSRVDGLGIRQIKTPVRAPKANAIAERFVGTLRRECLDHVFVFNERHLQKTVTEFVDYYNFHRPHRSLDQQVPCPGSIPPLIEMTDIDPPSGDIFAKPVLGGLHHIYKRVA